MKDSATMDIDSPHMRSAQAPALSLALMDARNHVLHVATSLLDAVDARARSPGEPAPANPGASHSAQGGSPGVNPVAARIEIAHRLGRLGWLGEYWTARNPRRSAGLACPSDAAHLASIEPNADRWWGQSLQSVHTDAPDLPHTRAYLLDVAETLQDLLLAAPETAQGLYFFRMALALEDQVGETLVRLAQRWGVVLPLPPLSAVAALPKPVVLHAGEVSVGWAYTDGFAWDNECPAHRVRLIDADIDAQPVNWAQFVEFVDDGGYDRAELWSPEGWAWLQGLIDGRRGPWGVEQIGVASGAVSQWHFGRLTRRAPSQPAMHVSWFEADAWCRWAGRRLPTEAEWEHAARSGERQGFRWGTVWEWTANTFRPYPGHLAQPWGAYSEASFGCTKVLRGASWVTRQRAKHVTFRGFAAPQRDDLFVGFRSASA